MFPPSSKINPNERVRDANRSYVPRFQVDKPIVNPVSTMHRAKSINKAQQSLAPMDQLNQQPPSQIVLGCRRINDIRQGAATRRGNVPGFDKGFGGSRPFGQLSRLAFTEDRYGISYNFRQPGHPVSSF